MSDLPTSAEVQEDIVKALTGAGLAADLRRQLRRRTRKRDPERQKQIEAMVEVLSGASAVLRTHLKLSDYHDKPYTAGIRKNIKKALCDLRYERRQLKKMLPDKL